jgi:hypothetical protein
METKLKSKSNAIVQIKSAVNKELLNKNIIFSCIKNAINKENQMTNKL